jgi:hypothetical protein
MDITASHPFPGDFDDFKRARTRFLDRLAADALLRRVEREAAASIPTRQEAIAMDPILVEGELSILAEERRLVIGFYTAGQHDLADVVRTSVEAQEAFGIVHVGPVRIRIEPLEPRP